MPARRFSIGLRVALAMLAMTVFVSGTCAAKVLHNFNPKGLDGNSPEAGVIFDAAGNLYGTTHVGGPNGHGTVFELIPNADGTWTEKVLYAFGNNLDGIFPLGGLIFDAAGNLYGTTSEGGPRTGGTVFELMPNADGTWTKRIILAFGRRQGGTGPTCTLIFDAAGNLYGTTGGGGTSGFGTVFELKPNGDSTWTELVLHNFRGGDLGFDPYAGVVFDAAGNLYGTTIDAGLNIGPGRVYELIPSGNRLWSFKILHKFKFDGHDGFIPFAGVTLDAPGNVYGTTYEGGSLGGGTAFELMRNADGTWMEKTLHNFKKNGKDGYILVGDLIFDDSGNLYGTTVLGGSDDQGIVFELTPSGEEAWTEKILHQFKNDGRDGREPWDGVIFDANGNLYGTTVAGGAHNGGTVFEVVR